ncbi:MAG: phosphatidylglycerol lysyltransferase domain-containing protein [Spirochaetes bacterium]|jgi:hypothetical protein|nr:phosphatidylglycerol lysyltransferase domain-containing protein [Spirochaetota bacterium]
MHTEPLALKHKEMLYDKLRTISIRLSEYSFANLYLFRKTHRYEVLTDDDCLFITGYTGDNQKFVLPLCKKNKPDLDQINKLLDEFGMIFPVCDCWLRYFDPREFEIYHNEDDSDYIYTVDKMASYSGRNLAKKRNLLKQFNTNHEYVREPLTKDNVQKAKDILNTWQQEISLNSGETDFSAATEAFEFMEELNLRGFLYIIDGIPGAYVLGEDITDDTFALHFAKGLVRFKGVYQFMYNDLAKEIHGKSKYIKFEQDLGLQSLRQAKSSYKPDHMGMKYRITKKQSTSC